jgi:hypothetical protein
MWLDSNMKSFQSEFGRSMWFCLAPRSQLGSSFPLHVNSASCMTDYFGVSGPVILLTVLILDSGVRGALDTC